MKEFKGRVAVVTGAASGIGFALAKKFAGEGMQVVLADIQDDTLAAAEHELKDAGAEVLAVRTNVVEPREVEQLAESAFSAFGNVHVLCNNAGVIPAPTGDAAWEIPLNTWEWVLGVNLMGIVHGVRSFVPRMLEGGEEGHVVNTSSIMGLVSAASPYNSSKHATLCLTEGLYKELKGRGTKLSASVLCPGWISTNLLESESRRPSEFGDPVDMSKLPEAVQQQFAFVEQMVKSGRSPDEVANQVFEAVRDDRFYVIPAGPDFLEQVRMRFEEIIGFRNPSFPGVPPAND